jgi:hypothetical protein
MDLICECLNARTVEPACRVGKDIRANLDDGCVCLSGYFLAERISHLEQFTVGM